MLFMDSLDNIKVKIFGPSDGDFIVKKIESCEGLVKQWYNNEPLIVKNIANSIYKNGFSDVKIYFFGNWSVRPNSNVIN